MPSKSAMIAITTSNSINVKLLFLFIEFIHLFRCFRPEKLYYIFNFAFLFKRIHGVNDIKSIQR